MKLINNKSKQIPWIIYGSGGYLNHHSKKINYSLSKLIQTCINNGVVNFDTASSYSYGLDEYRLGKILYSNTNFFKITTKVGFIKSPFQKLFMKRTQQNFSETFILSSFNSSLKRLKRNFIDNYLLHSPPLDELENGLGTLKKIKLKGLVKNIGFSMANLENISEYLNDLNDIDIIQIPCSSTPILLDKIYKKVEKNNTKLVLRGTYKYWKLWSSTNQNFKKNNYGDFLKYIHFRWPKLDILFSSGNISHLKKNLNQINLQEFP